MSYKNFNELLFCKNLKKLRKSSGYTQAQVEAKLDLRPMAIFDFERGRIKLNIETAIQLANLYDCSLEEIYSIEKEKNNTETKETSDLRFLPVLQTGISNKNYYIIHHHLITDPIIMADLGLNEVPLRKSPFDRITDKLTENQKRKVTIEVLKYMSSLINIDNKITTEEKIIFNELMSSLSFPLTEQEKSSINRANKKVYLGKTSPKYFKTDAIKRFLVWLLIITAKSDNDFAEEEESYIKRIVQHIGLRLEDFHYIKKKVISI
ncbi:tellurite resistance protein TerB [Bacteriovorax sp. BAL6_X]|uniref:helix-turn-helix domain-containing protein n=1 Tax=Bacteriovorax sp. BAL6_X TaxID=1201290 RepID=UPI0003855B92|nr:helix-turn-helix transcriptional regulator [Bacteriovorax sp. BAL6_X]EPZ50953.1 tellurite resistance protein TerB [Bacteriovorax sp. BAL6_X]